METFERPALGVNIGLGMLYDARADSFLSESALTMEVQDECTLVDWQESKTVALCEDDNLASKCETLGLSSSLVASCLAGMVSYEGSGLFLTAKKSAIGDEIVYHALRFATSTVRQQLNLAMVELRASLTDCAPEATHLCTQILFGGCCTITATGSIADPAKRAQLQRKFMDASSLVQEYETHDIDLVALMQVVDLVFDPQLSMTCYSDLPFIGHGRPTISQVKQHLEMMFALNTGAAYGAAKPLQYTMTPIHVVTCDTNSARSVGHLAESELKVAFNVANSFESARSQLAKHLKRLRDNEASVRAEEVLHCHNAIEDFNTAESKFHIALPDILADVRNRVASSTDFKEFIEEFTTGLSSPKRFLSIIPRASGKMNLIDDLRARGATCIKSVDVNQHALSARYAFYFSDVATGHPSWAKNIHLVMQILGNQSALLLAIDCDMDAPPLSKAKVSQLKNGEVVVDDMIERHEREASLCFLKYDPGSVDASMKDAPAQHKSVKISCPGKHCDSATRDWVCQQCRVQVEFGVVDAYFYCDCGRASVNSASFHCQQQDHGEFYTRFPSKDLQALLQRLPVPSEINVLILGETGVGKSTFINAFINYLSFGTLDEALATKNLNCIIPCSFSTQSEAPDGRLVQNEVRVGQDKDEHDGSKGSSATQDSTVYLIDYAGDRVRLIDTPGIGDTRGKDMDEENLKKILRVLRNYDKLHGILILLKPNNARLTVLFNYTIQELLTQLHKSAAQNIVFGFTNTRGSNYQPGDTFEPLQRLLQKHGDVIPGLTKDTVYCYDSESFRYLAARHKGVDMGHIDEYRNSWNHSAQTARRMVEYFAHRKPHEVRNTVSLNETRHLIAELIGPMARITSAIADTLAKQEKQIHDLQNTQLKGKKLVANLLTTKIVIDSKPLDKPMTVCSNSKCCSYASNGSPEGATVTLFKSRCHDPCNLPDVPLDVVGAPQIPPCAAFGEGKYENCMKCGHHWREHQHIMIEYSERSETTTDPAVERALKANNDETSAKKMQIAALKKLNQELLEEQKMIQKSQARFRCYLDQHGITVYNDATIEYYEHLIKDEKSKVAKGGSRTRLEQMEIAKRTYQSFVDAMKDPRKGGKDVALDADGVYALIQKLYQMKHYGSNLKDCARKTGEAYAATYREKAYRIRTGGRHSRGGSVHGRQGSYTATPATPPNKLTKGSSSPSIIRRAVSSAHPSSHRNHDIKLGPSPITSDTVSAKSPKSPFSDSAYGSQASPSSKFSPKSPDPFAFDDTEDDFEPLRAVQTEAPPAYSGVKNRLLDDDLTIAHPSPTHGYTGAQPGIRGGYGNPQAVMITSGGPNMPFGPSTSKSLKSKWSSMKDKLKGKK